MPGRPHLTTHLRRPGPRRVRGVCALAAALTTSVLVACSGPTEIESYDLGDADRSACEAFVADLPGSLADEERDDVEPEDALGAAYGDPAITVTCGVPVPDDFDETARCDEVNGVGWFVPDGADTDPDIDLRLSAPGYRPVVEAVVPSDYRPDDPTLGDDTTAAVLATLSTLVDEHLTLAQRCDG
ncbi:DUF3515 domain-containing protein [Nocardioides sp.]|uniref:DUF3515 domain-containing protein n=1 Tax=Nocardioides sp. TaxID=35761 RepID=UPI0027210603|nr:DUF3515 domain-containing protein [Nocardioides sp.]MDO9455513.1 DUF3515 domain-containing protein [Nocardioides sp.]